ncbi:MAG: RloB domain-containing protein [Actinomyces sp.]|nr:RloB domain-containing protein [Actinomyces sp.]
MGRPNQRNLRRPRQHKTRYAVFTEGRVTELQYLEKLRQRIRPQHAEFKFIKIGKDPSAIYKRCLRVLKQDNFDQGIIVVDVDQHERLEEMLDDCRRSPHVNALVSNPCFELWLLWHATDRRGYTETRECVRLARINNLTGDKDLNTKFPIASFPEAAKRAQQAWSELAPNKKGPNPSSAMPWLIDLMTTPPQEN